MLVSLIARSGTIASGNVASGHLASGLLAGIVPASGTIGSGSIASGAVQGFFGTTPDIASGTVGVFDFGSGAVVAGSVGSGAVVSGSIASGQLGRFHIASGQLAGFELGSGAVVSGRIASGQIGNFHIASGQVQGLAGAGVPNVGSGTLNGFELGSGAVVSGRIASGQVGFGHLANASVQSGTIASGQVSQFQLASGAVNSGQVGSGAVIGQAGGGAFTIASGTVTTNDIGSGAVVSGLIASGQIGRFHIASGQLAGFELGSGAIVSGRIASGQVGGFHYASGSIGSGFWIGSGAVWGQAGVNQFCIASGTITTNDMGSGAVVSGLIASGQIGRFHIASGQLAGFELGSGAIVSGRVASGQVGFGHLANASVQSGTIASGQVAQFHLASGAVNSGQINTTGTPGTTTFLRGDFQWAAPTATIGSGSATDSSFGSGQGVQFVMPVISGLMVNPVITEEIVSGIRAVCYSQSGNLRVAMASVSGRMPAVGVVVDGVLSGLQATVYTVGTFQVSSGMADYSGWVGTPLRVGRSGQIVTMSGSFNSGGLLSGDVLQFVGVPVNSGSFTLEVGPISVSGFLVASGSIAAGTVVSGVPQSGSVTGQAGGGFFCVASGTLTTNDLGSGAVVSGLIASGQIGRFHVASGQFAGFELGSGAIVSGRIASGQIGNFHIASGQVQGIAGAGVPNIASGTCGGFELGSGAVVSGRIASGQVGTMHVASGGVQSGNILSGNVGQMALSSGCVNSGHLNTTGTPGTTVFLRGDFAWAAPTVGSGATAQANLASGLIAKDLGLLVSGYNPLTSGMTEEAISGVRAVCISQSGNIRTAMASVSGRMPAIGVVLDNVASGIQVNVHAFGTFAPTSGLVYVSGFGGQFLYVGRSGQLVTYSGQFNSGGFSSGDILQTVGTVLQTFSGDGNPQVIGVVLNETETPFSFGVTSGNIASGSIGNTGLSSGAVLSGNVASGQLADYHHASGTTVTFAEASTIWGSGTVFTVITSEIVSGIRAVCMDRSMSGLSVRIAMSNVSGRFPAMGVAFDNVLSGITCRVMTQGVVFFTSGLTASGLTGQAYYLGRSGQIVPYSGSFNSGGFVSGDILQPMGQLAAQSSGAVSGLFIINVQFPHTPALSGPTTGAADTHIYF